MRGRHAAGLPRHAARRDAAQVLPVVVTVVLVVVIAAAGLGVLVWLVPMDGGVTW